MRARGFAPKVERDLWLGVRAYWKAAPAWAAGDGHFAAGSGPLVSGTTLALVMAMAGRIAYCDELEGDGLTILRDRCQQADYALVTNPQPAG